MTPEKLAALRKADAIFSGEIREAGLNKKLYKYFPINGGRAKGNQHDHPARSDDFRRDACSGRLPYDLVERTVERILETTPLSDGCL